MKIALRVDIVDCSLWEACVSDQFGSGVPAVGRLEGNHKGMSGNICIVNHSWEDQRLGRKLNKSLPS